MEIHSILFYFSTVLICFDMSAPIFTEKKYRFVLSFFFSSLHDYSACFDPNVVKLFLHPNNAK